MGADPIAMCGNCREVVAGFHLTSCVACIGERFSVDINEKSDRVLSSKNIINKNWRPSCLMDNACEALIDLEKCIKNGHRVLVDPCW